VGGGGRGRGARGTEASSRRGSCAPPSLPPRTPPPPVHESVRACPSCAHSDCAPLPTRCLVPSPARALLPQPRRRRRCCGLLTHAHALCGLALTRFREARRTASRGRSGGAPAGAAEVTAADERPASPLALLLCSPRLRTHSVLVHELGRTGGKRLAIEGSSAQPCARCSRTGAGFLVSLATLDKMH